MWAEAHLLTWFVIDPISCCLPQVSGGTGALEVLVGDVGDWEIGTDLTRCSQKKGPLLRTILYSVICICNSKLMQKCHHRDGLEIVSIQIGNDMHFFFEFILRFFFALGLR